MSQIPIGWLTEGFEEPPLTPGKGHDWYPVLLLLQPKKFFSATIYLSSTADAQTQAPNGRR